MANHPSAEKRNRQRVKRTDRNRAVKSAVRTVIKKARTAIETAPKEAAATVKAAIRAVDKAKSKGVVHKKAAARKKARLARALHKATATATVAKLPPSVRFLPRRGPQSPPVRVRCVRRLADGRRSHVQGDSRGNRKGARLR